MRKADFTNVDEYISAQPETAQVVLRRVRSTVTRRATGAPFELVRSLQDTNGIANS